MVRIAVVAALVLCAPAFAGEPATGNASDRLVAASWRAYRAEVDRETAITWEKHRIELDPMETRGRRFQIDLDHIKPVRQCWLEELPPKECAALGNLRLMSAWLNRLEGCRAVCGR